MLNLFNTLLYQPLLNILVFLYQYLPGRDFGIAVIILTVLIKLVLYPLGSKSIKSQKALSEIQPKIKEIQEKYKDNKEEQTKQIFDLYRKEKVSPFSGCLPLLIQLPILIAIYRVFWRGLDPDQLKLLYSFVSNPGAINPMFLGLIDLSKPNIILAIFVGLAQFFQLRLISGKKTPAKKDDISSQVQKQMQYFSPVFMLFILIGLPSALGLYLLTTTLFTIAQQYIILKKNHEERGDN
ncbi:MAG: hypothetical protein A2365_00235 [Candidatus Nealsonbacteria bacterium RIFOXYB1_FULL_40_15]|uniref:Membrane insertase YidC/Oxa/ALB C-terminal domain-containing protein n=2 Tax=Candidatus Nealsoniibacteriota TaxID=1817911 RepID=A0A1G2ESG0_9BACT|nr:MAG: hypothetical protein A2365_00235 [Candidatus Nealsonbacteria bacterium RIFOXYB1_FULL_40_15]OGZ28713.1 MAG: hypothetical protein A2427_03500 [Candidatus Nealsonbacteria bacterium RIFOXYC1_FULL_40_7]OGZ29170.1 MAG: hypothetical protein A2562_01240 [Candidatus Nealsonbacteria bacterium RIFOXYD1_FULL_39_11]